MTYLMHYAVRPLLFSVPFILSSAAGAAYAPPEPVVVKDSTIIVTGKKLSSANNVFKLKKGQTVIFSGFTDNYRKSYSPDNPTGFIGTKFTSNKDVVMLNGNFNGQNANAGSSDIYLDISAPTPYLGTEYAVIKGNGSLIFIIFTSV